MPPSSHWPSATMVSMGRTFARRSLHSLLQPYRRAFPDPHRMSSRAAASSRARPDSGNDGLGTVLASSSATDIGYGDGAGG